MFKNPNEKKVQFSSPLIKKFICKGYVCQEIVGNESTIIYLRNEKISGFLDYQTKLKHLAGGKKY